MPTALKHKLRAAYQRLMRRTPRNERFARWLNLPPCDTTETRRGLILIQIDGLALTQFRKALNNGQLPFLRRMIAAGKYAFKPVYSGLPSATPAFQGELFYGVKSCVPAFEFIDRKERRRHVSFYPHTADKLARRLEKRGDSLLKGGHAYATNFSGGAAEARYCSETMNLESLVQAVNPAKLAVILLMHLGKLLRIIGFTLLECLIAAVDFFRGVFKGKSVVKEFTFIPARILVCVILRELIRFRMKMDIARGVPVLAANFLGYDEQAHRRGPNSAFAHWSLKGVDDVIRDVYLTAVRAECLNYQVIIYSDHGQEAVVAYDNLFGRSVKDAVRRAYDAHAPRAAAPSGGKTDSAPDYLYDRMRSVMSKQWGPKEEDAGASGKDIEITTMGPLGHVYLPAEHSAEALRKFAENLARQARIPLTLFRDGDRIAAVTADGALDLAADAEKILGADHPFLRETAADLERLCRHPNAGDLIISGWKPGAPPISFSIENGAHGGPGAEETRGVAILPPAIKTEKSRLRAMDIRNIVLEYFRKIERPREHPTSRRRQKTVAVLNYNIHSCLNLDGRYNPSRTARVIADLAPDIVALQEVDAHHNRSGFIHQAEYLADLLNMTYQFFPLIENGAGRYGLALLTRHPVIDLKCGYLPAAPAGKRRETRGVMMALIDAPAGPVRAVNTHFSLHPGDRALQAKRLLEDDWIGGHARDEPVVLCGDFNAGPGSMVYKAIAKRLRDVQAVAPAGGRGPKATFFSWCPVRRIDHIFISRRLTPVRVKVPGDYDARMTSDHLPLFAELAFDDREER